MRIQRAAFVVVVVVVFAGCFTESPPEEPRSRVDLRQALALGADVNPIGVTIAPDGQRYVFDELLGLYRIDGDAAVEVLRMDEMPTPSVPVRPPFTDVVAIAPDVFAMTAIGDGFLLDVTAMTMTQHFCYVPEGTPEDLVQRTDAIGYDAALDRIYAQPRTFDIGENLLSAQLAGYMRETGELVDWLDIDREIAAGGMAMIPGVGLVLGQGSRLDRYDQATYSSERIGDVGGYGVTSIQGLAYDAAAGTLLVLDGGSDQLVEIVLD
jgi:hypothetical protein